MFLKLPAFLLKLPSKDSKATDRQTTPLSSMVLVTMGENFILLYVSGGMMYKIVLLFFIIFSILFVSCNAKTEQYSWPDKPSMTQYFCGDNKTNDDITLDIAITNEYDLSELQTYFENCKMNEIEPLRQAGNSLSFNDVNQNYPVEVLRSGGYSVYKVKQGGYYYVFWIQPFSDDLSEAIGSPLVYFSSYLPDLKSLSEFDSLEIGKSTAKDVLQIDPSSELSFNRSTGVYSYTILENDTVLEIKYKHNGELTRYEDLIIEKIECIPRESAPSRYCTILAKDLPSEGDKGTACVNPFKK